MLARVKKFLSEELFLELSEQKTLITNLNLDKVHFLGTGIFRTRITTYGRKSKGRPVRDNRTLRMIAPIDTIIKKLNNAGIIKNGISAPR